MASNQKRYREDSSAGTEGEKRAKCIPESSSRSLSRVHSSHHSSSTRSSRNHFHGSSSPQTSSSRHSSRPSSRSSSRSSSGLSSRSSSRLSSTSSFGQNGRSVGSGRDDRDNRDSSHRSVSEKKYVPSNHRTDRYRQTRDRGDGGHSKGNARDRSRDPSGYDPVPFLDRENASEDEEYQKLVEKELLEAEDAQEEIIQESRLKRQAILEKYKGAPNPPCAPSSSIISASCSDEEFSPFPPPLHPPEPPDSSPVILGSTEAGFVHSPGASPPESPGSWFLSDDVLFGARQNSPEKRIDNQLVEETKDEEGYFCYKPGTLLGPEGRYKLVGRLGKGQYSNVFRAVDCKKSDASIFSGSSAENTPHFVAIKMLRHIDVMSQKDLKDVARQELSMLKCVCKMDPKDKYSCVRFIDSFEAKDHLCIVFESLHLNLRELMHQYGRNIGLNIDAVRVYGRRLALSLYHLKKCGIIHADFKLDNILVGEDRKIVKLADFGCASFSSDNIAAPLLVSRYYRPPEVLIFFIIFTLSVPPSFLTQPPFFILTFFLSFSLSLFLLILCRSF